MPLTRDIKSEIDEYLSRVLTEKKDIIDKVVSAVQQTITEKLSEIIEVLRSEIVELKEQIGSLTNKNEKLEELKSEMDRDKKEQSKLINSIQEKNDNLEQYTRRQNLRVFGIKEERGEACEERVIRLFQEKLHINITPQQIDRCHRSGRYNENKPRGIIVKFISYKDRNAIFEKKKFLKHSGVTISEDLTKQRITLLKDAGHAFGFENCWTRDGRVLIKRNGRIHTIVSRTQLQKLSE